MVNIDTSPPKQEQIKEIVLGNAKAIFIDLDSDHGHLNRNDRNMLIDHVQMLASLKHSNHPLFLVKCDFSKWFLFEVIYLLNLLTRYKRVFLVTHGVSTRGIEFLKRINVKGIITENEIDSVACLTILKNAKPFYISKSLIPYKGNHESDLNFFFDLSATELEILYLISIGLSNGEISKRINRSYHTIKNHKSNIVRKVGAKGSSQLFAFALKLQGLRL